MQGNWARWQQPIGDNCNYNFQFQSFHCGFVPQTPQTQSNINTSWQQQLQLYYLNLLAQYQQQHQFTSSSFYGQFGSAFQPFNSSVNCGQNCTRYNNYNKKNSSSSPSSTTKGTNKFTEQSSETVTVPNSSDSINNDETMEPKDFVMATRFNAFAVNFKNTNALSEDQVHEIFSVFGKIKRLKQTGDEHGLFFVNYENEEDALKAAAGVKGHPDVRLRATKLNRSKHSSDFNNGGGNDKNFNGNSENNYSNENGENNYSNGNNKVNNYSNFSDNNFSNSNGNNYSNEKNKTDCFNELDDKIVESTSNKFPVTIPSEVNTEIKTTEAPEPARVSNYRDEEVINTFQSSDTLVSTLPPVMNHHDKSDQRSAISANSAVQIPDLVLKISRMSISSSNSDSLAAMLPIEKMAAEVLVANIHAGINIHTILQLLDKYHPLAATNILTYKPSNMRYCRVYFATQKCAEDVEAEFDNCVLLDKHLLVMRASSLVN